MTHLQNDTSWAAHLKRPLQERFATRGPRLAIDKRLPFSYSTN